jgi:hypothetical protein
MQANDFEEMRQAMESRQITILTTPARADYQDPLSHRRLCPID